MARTRPPRVARALLASLLPPEAREETLADLEAIWLDRARTDGKLRADVWYARQVWLALAPSLGRRLNGTGDGEGIMESIGQDVRFGLTQLRRHLGVGVVVVLTLGLGIGATTSIFSAVQHVLLRSLPYDEPHELVMITSSMGGSTETLYLSGPDLMDLVDEVESIESVTALGESTVGPLTDADRPEHILTVPVHWNFFEVLGVEAALGRLPSATDGVPLGPHVTDPPPVLAVISHAFWQRSFGGDPEVIGRVVRVWGGASEIVGVLPEGLRLDVPPELNISPSMDSYRVFRWDLHQASREGRAYRVVARLADGASLQRARAEVNAFAERLRARHQHHALEETGLQVTSLEDAIRRPVRGPLAMLMGAVSLVLLIACANVANLLLARGTARAGEMAVRASLGAPSGRLARQLLTESAVLAALGAVVGIGLAAAGVRVLQAIRPAELHRFADVGLDVPVLAFSAVAAVLTTLLAGLLPALHGARAGLAPHLTVRGGRAASSRARTVLVVGEVAMSVVLLVGAGLLIRTFSELERMPLGFEPDRVLTVTATQTGRPQEERQAYEAELIRAVEQVPGVAASGIVFPLPMNGVYERSAEYATPERFFDPAAWRSAYFRTVSPGYFDAMGLALRSGRGFDSRDEVREAPVVVLDERVAAAEFPDGDALGRRLFVRGMVGDTINPEIVGIVEWSPQGDHRDERPTMYFPRAQYQSHEVSVVARVDGDPAAAGFAIVEAIRGVDPTFPADLRPMSAYVAERLASSRFLLILMQVFAAAALTLAAVGLYGVLSYAVRQRSRELGLRLALGARAPSLTLRVVRSGLALAAGGVGIGLIGALGLSRVLEAQLFGVRPADPSTITATALLVLATAALASLIPALRAARVDPVEVLSEE